jgi:hypothetical protein
MLINLQAQVVQNYGPCLQIIEIIKNLKSRTTTTWAFYALLKSPSPKVGSSANSLVKAKQLKCVVC